MFRGSTALSFFAALVLATSACPSDPTTPGGPGTPGSGPSGTWKPKSFTRAGEGCSQLWTCDCSSFPPKAGCKMEASRDGTTEGACAADTGPHTACTRCMALPPPTACECRFTCP